MNITTTLYITNRITWRGWLRKHYKTEKDIWLVYYRKESGKPRIAYNDAVEEALCFGWIDSTIKKIDHERFAQRFSPRNPKSGYSQANKVRLRNLIRRGKVRKEVVAALGNVSLDHFVFPPDIMRAIRANKRAWVNFRKFSKPYKEIRIGFITAARKRPDIIKKRLAYFIKMTEKNKQFGFGGIERHF
jgi:uncharacterized protein YdeI (YjbR/CyaY-like superfamily)